MDFLKLNPSPPPSGSPRRCDDLWLEIPVRVFASAGLARLAPAVRRPVARNPPYGSSPPPGSSGSSRRCDDLQDFVKDVREQNADNCQEFLGESVEAGAPWAIKYTLRTLGANRGYGNPGAGNREPGSDNREPGSGKKEPGTEDQRLPLPAAANWRLAPNDPLVPAVKSLEQAKGHVTRAAAALGKTRSALQKLIAESPALQMAVYQERESLVDHAEWALRKAVQAKRPWAIMFTLSTRRRAAGYGRPSKRAILPNCNGRILSRLGLRNPAHRVRTRRISTPECRIPCRRKRRRPRIKSRELMLSETVSMRPNNRSRF